MCKQHKVCDMRIIMCALYTVSVNLGTEICEVTIFIRKTALCGLKKYPKYSALIHVDSVT